MGAHARLELQGFEAQRHDVGDTVEQDALQPTATATVDGSQREPSARPRSASRIEQPMGLCELA